ncbi:TonB-dependent receptor plug domain-containing protein [Marinomonas algarum]|uniref:TonB-dependent receptor n=1 Tax=Marinomonas algarum TaxID=2883105 RepID=A0A9X1LFD1_9GAMM|nr:TonB-dependent receptor [Marinomonas algarum]MCB5162928.1 TonB-dependent receptor [Marinomonas algarum]
MKTRTPLLLCMMATMPAFAEDIQRVTLNEVVVTATKTERDISSTPVSTEVYTQSEIEAVGAKNLKDIFHNIPGIYLPPNGGSMSIRGVSGKGTLLLIDGRRIGSEYSNFYDTTRIPAHRVERVEVIKGPAGALYGSDALGGVINIITKKPEDELEASISTQSGMNSEGQAEVTEVGGDVRGRSGKTGFSAWFSAQNTESYTETETAQLQKGGQPPKNVGSPADVNVTYQAPSEIFNIGGELNHDVTKDLLLKVSASYMEESRDAVGIANAYRSNIANPKKPAFNVPFLNVETHQKLENERTDISIGADYNVTDTLTINWQSSQSNYKKEDTITTPMWQQLGYTSESQSSEGATAGTGRSTAIDHQLSSTWTPNERNRVLVGSEYVEDKRKADFFSSDGSTSTQTIQTTSLFAQHEWQATDPLSFVYGLRSDDRKSGDDAVTFNAGGIYQFNKAANLRLRYAQGFRAPDSQELYMNRFMPNSKRLLGTEVIDSAYGKNTASDLESEHSDNYEIGLLGSGKDWSYNVAIYQNQITDSIQPDDSNGNYRTFKNASKVSITGFEFSGSKQLMESLYLDLYANIMNTKDDDTNERLEYTPEQLYSITLDYQVTPSLSTMLIAQYVGDQDYTEKNKRKTADAYTPVNVKLSYSPEAIHNTDFFAGIDNILDTKVDKALGSNVGTYVYGGLRVYF